MKKWKNTFFYWMKFSQYGRKNTIEDEKLKNVDKMKRRKSPKTDKYKVLIGKIGIWNVQDGRKLIK